MTLAIVHSRSLDGLAAAPVSVEVHLATGLPSFTLVGLAETEVKEARVCLTRRSEQWVQPNQWLTRHLQPQKLPFSANNAVRTGLLRVNFDNSRCGASHSVTVA